MLAKAVKIFKKLKKSFLVYLFLVVFLTLFTFSLWGVVFLNQSLSLNFNSSLKKSVDLDNSTGLVASSKTKTEPKPTPVSSPITLVVGGDVMLARSVTTKMRGLNNFSYPLAQIAPFLRGADLALVNLESPFGWDCESTDEGMKFCADFRAIETLIEAGVDLVSLANNHSLDQGELGLTQTIDFLKENFITPIGLREPVILEVKGSRLIFLAYNAVNPQSDLVSWAYPEVVESEIKRFSQEADFLIVYFHWGREYAKTPVAGGGSPYHPRRLAHLAVDSGADLVLGAHPHVVQENEWYQEKLIVYSFGNLVFDQSWSAETQKGMIGYFTIGKEGLVSSEFLPVTLVDYQPKLEN
jgi:poly-gamma-glutamate synthesis protein (capsule biosynthesis protein)